MLEKRPSPIHGFGVYATQPIPAGKLIMNWMKRCDVINKEDHDPKSQTAIRLFGNLFIDGKLDDTDFINHSEFPNCIYLFGLVFTMRDIEQNEELYLDYQHLMPPEDFDVVQGVPADEEIFYQLKYLFQNWKTLKV